LVRRHPFDENIFCGGQVTWSAQLASAAQQWANRCDFNHDQQSPHGENLFWGTSGAYLPQAAVAAWYEEIAVYNFLRPGFTEQAGHFTQVVWSDSRQLGCGMAMCRGNHFWVCRYLPAGNVTGQFSRHVPKPCA
jgi:pathogenesis-related protein 1